MSRYYGLDTLTDIVIPLMDSGLTKIKPNASRHNVRPLEQRYDAELGKGLFKDVEKPFTFFVILQCRWRKQLHKTTRSSGCET
jgi:hypothetical protein